MVWFAEPWILTSLVILPLVWWLLKVTPPSPRQIRFPPLRLLRDIEQSERTSAKTPWWLVLLRLTILALIILGLSEPTFGPDRKPETSLIIVLDDGWRSASYWDKITSVLEDRLQQDKNRPVSLLTTAQSSRPLNPEFSPAHRVAQGIEGLTPKPWGLDRQRVADVLDRLDLSRPVEILWLSDGLEAPGTRDLAVALQRLGPLEIMSPEPTDWPYALSASRAGAEIQAAVDRIASHPDTVWIQGKDDKGRLLIQEPLTFDNGQTQATIAFPAQHPIASLRLANRQTSATTFLLDPRWRRHLVALVIGCRQTEAQPLLRDDHYLVQALAPYATVTPAELDAVLAESIKPSILILADLSPLTPEQRTRLEEWIDRGGLLIRFAGPCLAQNPDPLTPVVLRPGERHLGGQLSWDAPVKLGPFPQHSPFFGLKIVEDVRVNHQIFTQPSLELSQKSWAYLEDGTPLITAERRKQGLLILIHTTAGPEWSNLALSGLFVQMLERILSLGTGTRLPPPTRPLPPLMSLDGFGDLQPPLDSAQPLTLAQPISLGPNTPPGYYGDQEFQYPLNLSERIPDLTPFQTLPPEISQTSFRSLSYFALKPWLLVLAFGLGLIDVLVLFLRQFRWMGVAVTALLIHIAVPAGAQDDSWKLSLQAHLAYVTTEPSLDRLSHAGLTQLASLINRRTAITIASVIAVDPETDSLSFLPLIYWPMSTTPRSLSEEARNKINHYLAHGGMILFDTRDHPLGNLLDTPEKQALKRVTQGLSIPSLRPIPKDHTLTKSFYLLSEFPGRQSGGVLWVSETQRYQNDTVSSVLLGSNDWAGAWATDSQGKGLFAAVPGGERQRELAYRFGINLLMYAMTGNYKSDQVHIEEILRRRQLTQ